jgi:transposase
MFSLTSSDRFYLYPHPTDMRKSFYTLSGIVSNNMGMDIQDGSAFIFINKNCTSLKILHMEYGGLVIYHMKLSQGQFSLPNRILQDETKVSYETVWSDLVMMVQGIDTKKVKRHKRWVPQSCNSLKKS